MVNPMELGSANSSLIKDPTPSTKIYAFFQDQPFFVSYQLASNVLRKVKLKTDLTYRLLLGLLPGTSAGAAPLRLLLLALGGSFLARGAVRFSVWGKNYWLTKLSPALSLRDLTLKR